MRIHIRPESVNSDDTGWYLCVFALDTTQGTASDRAAIYLNGVKQTNFGTETYPGQNTTPNWNNSSKTHTIGAWELNGSMADPFVGYLSQFYFIVAQKLDGSYFGWLVMDQMLYQMCGWYGVQAAEQQEQ